MADQKLSALTAATTPLGNDDLLYVVQGGVSKRVPASAIGGGGGGSGTVTGAQSEGSGTPIFNADTSTSSTLHFKSLAAGANTSVTDDGEGTVSVAIDATDIIVESEGTGTSILDENSTSTDLLFKSLAAGDNVTITDDDAGTITISSTGGGGGGPAILNPFPTVLSSTSFNNSGNDHTTWELDIASTDPDSLYWIVSLDNTDIPEGASSYTWELDIDVSDTPTTGHPFYVVIKNNGWLFDPSSYPGGANIIVNLRLPSGPDYVPSVFVQMPTVSQQSIVQGFIGSQGSESSIIDTTQISMFSAGGGFSLLDNVDSTASQFAIKSLVAGNGLFITDNTTTLRFDLAPVVISEITSSYEFVTLDSTTTLAFDPSSAATLTIPTFDGVMTPGISVDVAQMTASTITIVLDTTNPADKMVYYSPTGAGTCVLAGKGATCTIRLIFSVFNGLTSTQDQTWLVTGAIA